MGKYFGKYRVHGADSVKVTQAPITKTKKRAIQMHTLDWLSKRGRMPRGAIQPIECILFASLLFSSVTRP